MIENVARMAGMPVGPLALTDEVAVDLAWKILKATGGRPRRPTPIDPAQKELLAELVVRSSRFGRKNRKGFYDYPDKGEKRLWPGARRPAEGQARPRHHRRAGAQGLACLGIQALENRALLRGGLSSPTSARPDVGLDPRLRVRAVFPGGTLSYIDMMGTAPLRRHVREARRHARPAPLRRRSSSPTWPRRMRTFYGRFPPALTRKRPA